MKSIQHTHLPARWMSFPILVLLLLATGCDADDDSEDFVDCGTFNVNTECPVGTLISSTTEPTSIAAQKCSANNTFLDPQGSTPGICFVNGGCQTVTACLIGTSGFSCQCGIASATATGVTCNPCPASCGDGTVDADETCDLGAQNGMAGSGCSSTCNQLDTCTATDTRRCDPTIGQFIQTCVNGHWTSTEACPNGMMCNSTGCQ